MDIQCRGALPVKGEILRSRHERTFDDPGIADDAPQDREHLRGERRIVDGDGIAEIDTDVGGGTRALRDQLGGADYALANVAAHRGVESPDRAQHDDAVGDDVAAHPALDAADRDDRRAGGEVGLPADDRLKTGYDLCRDGDRIDPFPRECPVRLAAVNYDGDRIAARHEGTGPVQHVAQHERHDVQPKHRVGLGIVEGAFAHHKLGPAILTRRRHLFRRLEQEDHGARQIAPYAGEDLRHAHEHRGVRIVSAGVHDADVLAVVGGARGRCEWQAGRLGDGQGVHVGAERDHWTGTAAAQNANDARVGHTGADGHPEGRQVIGDELRRAELAVAELGVLVDVTAPGDDLAGHRGYGAIDRGVEGGGRRCGLRAQGERRRSQRHGREEHPARAAGLADRAGIDRGAVIAHNLGHSDSSAVRW